jgi:hypothetical protein
MQKVNSLLGVPMKQAVTEQPVGAGPNVVVIVANAGVGLESVPNSKLL